jgi:hypothetical protein
MTKISLFIELTLVPQYGTLVGYCARRAMSEDKVLGLIQQAIREHELRVALWSGLLGAALMAGTWHAILLCKP